MPVATPTSWWRLGEATGQVRADSGSAGVTQSDAGATPVDQSTPGLILPHAASFNDIDQALIANDPTALRCGVNVPLTVVSWVKITGRTTVHNIVWKGISVLGSFEYGQRFNPGFSPTDDRFESLARTTGGLTLTAVADTFGQVPIGTKCMIALRFSSANGLRISINAGVSDSGLGSGSNIRSGTGNLCIGADNAASNFTEGVIGPVGIWINTELSDADLTTLYASGNGFDPTAPDTGVGARVLQPSRNFLQSGIRLG